MINKVTLIGRLGSDPEIRHTNNNTAVANFSLATSRKYNDKQTNELKEVTQWHRIVVWGKSAEACGKYLTKGKQVYVEGELNYRQWDDQNGQKRYATDIVAREIKFLGSSGQTQGQGQGQSQSAPVNDNPPSFESDDDIPF